MSPLRLITQKGLKMFDDREVCGTCRWHRTKNGEDWYCIAEFADENGDYTDYDHTCDEWEERE